MPSAAPAIPRDNRLATAVITSLLGLVITCLPYLVQPGVESKVSQCGFVNTLDQIALSAHSESIRLQNSTNSGEKDSSGEPDSHAWLTIPRSDLLLAATTGGNTFSSIETQCLPSGCDYLKPPLRAPPLV